MALKNEYIDRYPNLPLMVDVAGFKYYLGTLKPVELAYKSRSDFLNAFGSDPQTEFILRKYMYPEISSKEKLIFDSPSEKQALIKILKKRANDLKITREFSSSTLKNSIFQKSYLELQELILKLETTDYKNKTILSLPSVGSLLSTPERSVASNNIQCNKSVKYIKDLYDSRKDRILELILEMSWLLLHPDMIPSNLRCSWANLVAQLDTMRLGDIMTLIKESKADNITSIKSNPLNYLESMNLYKIGDKPTIKNALTEARNMAVEIQNENARNDIKKRLQILLNILETKKYLNNSLPIDESRMKIIDTDETAAKISRQIISNPMKGGNANILNKPLKLAMNPVFDYFKKVYHPIYDFLEDNIKKYTAKIGNTPVKSITIPSLLVLLHICNNIQQPPNSGDKLYGLYKLQNAPEDLKEFVSNMLTATRDYTSTINSSGKTVSKTRFKSAVFMLPTNIYPITLLNTRNPANSTTTATFSNAASNIGNRKYYLQFLIGGTNMSGSLSGLEDDVVGNGDLFIAITKDNSFDQFTRSSKQNVIEVNRYTIDFNSVDVAVNELTIQGLDSSSTASLKFDDDIYFNNAELALSIFIALKELMPE
jgi:hypothetical protein